MDRFEKTMFALVGIAILVFGQSLAGRWHSETTQHDIYYATLPFGFIFLEGEMGGAFIFGFGSISGQIGMSETYNIKYMKGNELITLTFDAEEIPLIVDGIFQVEKTVHWRTSYILFWKQTMDASYLTEYEIHIPYLPEVNRTLTEDWIK